MNLVVQEHVRMQEHSGLQALPLISTGNATVWLGLEGWDGGRPCPWQHHLSIFALRDPCDAPAGQVSLLSETGDTALGPCTSEKCACRISANWLLDLLRGPSHSRSGFLFRWPSCKQGFALRMWAFCAKPFLIFAWPYRHLYPYPYARSYEHAPCLVFVLCACPRAALDGSCAPARVCPFRHCPCVPLVDLSFLLYPGAQGVHMYQASWILHAKESAPDQS